MAQSLALAPRRIITPVAAFLLAVALLAALALGFGIRSWTESTNRPLAPTGSVHGAPSHAPAPAEPLRKLGRPF